MKNSIMKILYYFLKSINKNKYFNILNKNIISNEINFIEYFYCLTFKDLIYDYKISEIDSIYIIKKLKEFYKLDNFLQNINYRKYIIIFLENGYNSLEKLKKARLNYLIKFCNINKNDGKFILQTINR